MNTFITTHPEITILTLNTILILISYLLLYPKLVKNNINKLLTYDLLISIISLIISGVLYWNTKISFSLILFDTNWFWFSLITYFLLELVLFSSYLKKYQINLDLYAGQQVHKQIKK